MSCHDEDARPTAKIRELNDQLRRTMPHGRVMLTRAVADLDPATVLAIIKAVKAFDNFSEANDPWGTHDFGQMEVGGVHYFWKIDAYDLNLEWGSPDPTDDAVTKRIITIMTAQDL